MSSSSALQQIDAFLSAGDYYSAHQKALTTATRLLAPPRRGPAPKPSAEGGFLPYDAKAEEAAELLWTSSRRLLEKAQKGSGAELASRLVDVWKTRGVKCSQQERAKIIQLIALMGPSGSWRKQLTDAVFSWSAKTGSGPAGDVDIHQYLGETLYKEQNYHHASLHLLVCPTQDAARTLADVMFAWSQLDNEGASAVGRYAARGTLSYLESTAILAARTFLAQFIHLVLTAHPNLLVVRFAYPPPSSPLARSGVLGSSSSDEIVVTKLASLNFLQLAVKNCQTGAGETVEPVKDDKGVSRDRRGDGRKAWVELCKRYEREVKWLKSPEAKESTQELGTIFFGIKPPRPAGNMFAEMMSGMLGGGGGGR